MAPADQRFGAVDPARRGVDLGLVMQLELVAAQCLVQLALELHALLRDRAHAFGIALHVVAAALLGVVHGRVRVRQQRIDSSAIAWTERNADAGRDVHVDAEEPHGRLHHLQQALAHLQRLRMRHRPVEDDHELVSPEACNAIDGADGSLEPHGHLAQELIAGAVAERVVDKLEAVEIQHRHRELMRLTVRLGNRLSDAVFEQQAVGEPGERVVRGEVTQLPVRRLKSAGAIGDGPLEALNVALERACVLPLAA